MTFPLCYLHFFFFFERFLSFSMTNWFDRHWYSNYNRLSVVQCAVAGGVQCICSVLWLVVVVCFSRLLISRKCLFFFFFPLGNKAVFCESECSLQPPVRQLCGPIHVLFSHEGTCIPNPCSVVQDEQFWDYRLWVRLMKSPKRHISRSETMYWISWHSSVICCFWTKRDFWNKRREWKLQRRNRLCRT